MIVYHKLIQVQVFLVLSLVCSFVHLIIVLSVGANLVFLFCIQRMLIFIENTLSTILSWGYLHLDFYQSFHVLIRNIAFLSNESRVNRYKHVVINWV